MLSNDLPLSATEPTNHQTGESQPCNHHPFKQLLPDLFTDSPLITTYYFNSQTCPREFLVLSSSIRHPSAHWLCRRAGTIIALGWPTRCEGRVLSSRGTVYGDHQLERQRFSPPSGGPSFCRFLTCCSFGFAVRCEEVPFIHCALVRPHTRVTRRTHTRDVTYPIFNRDNPYP